MIKEVIKYLSARSEVNRDVPAKDPTWLVGEDESAGLALSIDTHTGCETPSDKNEVLVGDDVDMGGSAWEVNTGLKDRVGVADDGRS